MKQGISVCLITKDCGAQLRKCLDSLKPFLSPKRGDEVVVVDTGSNDNTVRVAEGRGARVIERPDLRRSDMLELIREYLPDYYEESLRHKQFLGGFLGDFAAARQISFDEARNDLVFWLDADDILVGAAHLRKVAESYFREPKNSALFLNYHYEFDDDGACTTELVRERIVRKADYRWKGVCHESLIPLHGQVAIAMAPAECRLEHRNHREPRFSDVRNYVILRRALDDALKKGEWIDPRWKFYLGNACRGMELLDEALLWYGRTLNSSGSREDRFTAAANCGAIYIIRGRAWEALDWFFQALKIAPGDPRGPFAIGRCYYHLEKWAECVHWIDIGLRMPKPQLSTAADPQQFVFYPLGFKAEALAKLGDLPAAIQTAEQALALRPDFEPIQSVHAQLKQQLTNEQLKSSVAATIRCAASEDNARDMLHSLSPEFRSCFTEFQLERKADDEAITYLCGSAWEDWDATSAAGGIGGSEKMVIQLSSAWARAGRKVVVYGQPTDKGRYKTIDGVTWKPMGAFDPRIRRDTIVCWRHHALLDLPLNARKVFLDLHDVQSPEYYTRPRLRKCDGYFFKSRYHAEAVKDVVPPDKLLISRNGIDLTQFPETPGPRNYNKVVFTSSGDRGLLRALRIWQRVSREHPEAEFHIFYGFTPMYFKVAAQREYAFFAEEGCERHMLDYYTDCMRAIDRGRNVVMHGRIGHVDLLSELSTAGIWFYPTRFTEISCMAAMEAQIAGAVPVFTPTAALAETVQYGSAANSDDECVVALNQTLAKGHALDDYRAEMSTWARRAFDLDSLAAAWRHEFSRANSTDPASD